MELRELNSFPYSSISNRSDNREKADTEGKSDYKRKDDLNGPSECCAHFFPRALGFLGGTDVMNRSL